MKSSIAFNRYPKTSDLGYRRTITISAVTASYLKENNAVVVVHGIDYNSNGVYDGVLERSDLDRSLTGESTAPALCGPLKAGKAPPASGKSASTGSTQVFTASLNVSSDDAPDPTATPALFCPIHPRFRQA